MLLQGDYYCGRYELVKAMSFAGLLVVVFGLAIFGVFWNAGPIVLGTEMNTNGLVEYLCLGRGCDFGARMDW